MSIHTQEIEFTGHGGDTVRGHLAASTGEGSGVGIVLIHEVFGLDVHMRSVAARFAELGHTVLVPDLYSREGVPGPPSTPGDPAPIWEVETIRAASGGVDDRRAVSDIDAAAGVLAGRGEVDGERVATVGFCMGGTLSFLTGCTSRRIGGCVSFYGRIVYPELSREKPTQPIEMALNLDRPYLALFAEEDEGIPAEDVELLRSHLTAGAKNFEVVCYPEARHGFFNDLRPNHHPGAAEDAWSRTLRFLEEDL